MLLLGGYSSSVVVCHFSGFSVYNGVEFCSIQRERRASMVITLTAQESLSSKSSLLKFEPAGETLDTHAVLKIDPVEFPIAKQRIVPN